jgi:ATP synthase F1 complex assembly factor 1
MPRDTGLEFFFLQFQSHQCNFTSLLEYKTKGEKARPFLTITHYPELAEEKGIVLMKGDINDDPKKMLLGSNAQFLAFALQRFYSTDDPQKLKLVELFNTSPEEFDYQELIKEMESVVPLQ